MELFDRKIPEGQIGQTRLSNIVVEIFFPELICFTWPDQFVQYLIDQAW